MSYPKRGEIYLVEFDPTRGSEIRKTRPAVVIQNDIGNRHSPITIVAAVTSKFSPAPYPVEVVVQPDRDNGLSVASAINLGQVRSIDRERLVKRLGAADSATMRKVDDALRISLGLIAL